MSIAGSKADYNRDELYFRRTQSRDMAGIPMAPDVIDWVRVGAIAFVGLAWGSAIAVAGWKLWEICQ